MTPQRNMFVALVVVAVLGIAGPKAQQPIPKRKVEKSVARSAKLVRQAFHIRQFTRGGSGIHRFTHNSFCASLITGTSPWFPDSIGHLHIYILITHFRCPEMPEERLCSGRVRELVGSL